MEHHFNWFEWLFSPVVNVLNVHIFTGLTIAGILIAFAALYRSQLKGVDRELIPEKGISFKNIFQASIEALLTMMEGIIGPHAKQYFPLLATVFIFVFVNNVAGAIPGTSPATTYVHTNFAVAITVFVYYNYIGIKKQGLKHYLQHMAGPIWWIAPLIFVIELISHIARPFTLSWRLMLNMNGDHIVLGVFSGLVPILVPIVFLLFGLFVAFVQAFVFTLLSTVYISLAEGDEAH